MNHAPAVTIEERGQCGLAHPAGSVKIELEGVEPLRFSDAKEAAVELQSARVVHQPVNPAVPLHDRCDDARGAGGVGEVSADRTAFVAEPGLDNVAVDAHDDAPFRGQHAGGGPADCPPRAREARAAPPPLLPDPGPDPVAPPPPDARPFRGPPAGGGLSDARGSA